MEDNDDVFEPRILSGLQNLGNTCYFNSGLQLLASATPFVSALTQVASSAVRDDDTSARHAGLHPFHSASRAALLRTATETLDEMQSGGQAALAPIALLRLFSKLNPQFEGMHQQDCPEMVTALLSQLEDEVKTEVYTSELLKELGAASPASPSSQRYKAMLELLENVHAANAEEEVQSQHKKGKLEYTAADYHPPRWVRSCVSDCFRGAALHTISCSRCSYVSRTVDEFTSLSVEIPSASQRRGYAMRHPSVVRYDAEGAALNAQSSGKDATKGYRWWNPVRYIANVCSFVYACVVGDEGLPYPLTLEECLDIHFDEERLHGANKYRCPKCEVLVDATKKHTLLWCPEVLTIHLKRFEVGAYWTSKRHDPIIFPAGHGGTRWQRPLDLGVYEALLGEGSRTSYELTGVVNHHGSFGGGHYTAFAHKGAELGWVLCNDSSVKRADASDVVDSQEYLLMYRKMRPADAHGEERSVAKLARSYMSGSAPKVPLDGGVLVLRSWLHRVATFVEPGPLFNRLCYCGSAKPSEHFHGTVAGAYVPVAEEDYISMSHLFGGPPLDQMLRRVGLDQTLTDEVRWLRK